MSEPVTWRVVGRTAVVTINHPPVNALSREVRAGLMAALDAAEDDPSVEAIAIVAAGAAFSSGADMREFGRAPAAPTPADLCDRVEACFKPVIAGLHGLVLGGGFELALASHWRLAAQGAEMGFPEVRLGLMPAAGGSYRMPRLCGARTALDLLLTGDRMGAAEAARAGILDGVVQGDIAEGCVGLAENLLERGIGVRRTVERSEGLADPRAYMAEVSARRAALPQGGAIVAARLLDCVEAALLLPVETLRAFEADAVRDCLADPASEALRHLFLAERRASRPAIGAARTALLSCLGLVGPASRTAAVAAGGLDAGLAVVLAAETGAALGSAIGEVERLYAARVESGRLTEDEAAERLARLEGVAEAAAFAACDAVLVSATDASSAELTVRRILPHLEAHALVAIDGDTIDITRLGSVLGAADRCVGFHVASADGARRLVEIAPGRAVGTQALARAYGLARRLGRLPVVSARPEGTLTGRLGIALHRAAEGLLLDGATPDSVDRALRAAGFLEGAFERADRHGLAAVAAAIPAPSLAGLLAREGRPGGAGPGFHAGPPAPGGVLRPDPAAVERIARERSARGLTPRRVTAPEIERRVLAALAAEGARLIEDGVVPRPSDLDLIAVEGLGAPRRTGGPMHWADVAGLLMLREDMRAWSAADPGLWAPILLWDELIKYGRRFAELEPPSA